MSRYALQITNITDICLTQASCGNSPQASSGILGTIWSSSCASVFGVPCILSNYLLGVLHLILESNNQDPEFHTKLAQLYVEVILNLLNSSELNHSAPGTEIGLVGVVRCIEVSHSQTRKKLLHHLETSRCYNEGILLTQIVTTPLYEECIILYRRVPQGAHLVSLHVS